MFEDILTFLSGFVDALLNVSKTELYTSIAVAGAAVFFVTLERLFPYRKHQKFFREGLFNDFFLYTIAQSYVLGLVFANFVDLIDSYTGLRSEQILGDVPVWIIVLGSLFVHDFYIYWFHKWQHFNEYLWRLHEAHHSTKDMDWLSGSRSHALEILINQTVEFGVLILLGAPPEALVIKGAISAIWGMWIHTNVDIHTGKLQYIINGPEMHRWHHADKDEEAWNINFATKFAFWDWMFGSAYLPEKKRVQYYGISEKFPRNYFMQFLFAFRKMKQ